MLEWPGVGLGGFNGRGGLGGGIGSLGGGLGGASIVVLVVVVGQKWWSWVVVQC